MILVHCTSGEGNQQQVKGYSLSVALQMFQHTSPFTELSVMSYIFSHTKNTLACIWNKCFVFFGRTKWVQKITSIIKLWSTIFVCSICYMKKMVILVDYVLIKGPVTKWLRCLPFYTGIMGLNPSWGQSLVYIIKSVLVGSSKWTTEKLSCKLSCNNLFHSLNNINIYVKTKIVSTNLLLMQKVPLLY